MMSAQTKNVESSNELTPVESEIINMIREQGQLSRSELAKSLGYSRASMTTFVNRLMELNILVEAGEGVSQGGRRPLILEINGQYGYVVGIDIGATSIDVAIADFRGEILAHQAEPADVRDDAEVVLGRCSEIGLELLNSIQGDPNDVVSVGVGVPGPVEFAKGILIAPPLMPTWENFQIKDFIKNSFPSAIVVVDNDVNAMAIGEQSAGLGKDINNFIFVKIGTGIGSGIVANGQIYRGANGVAGNIGHISVDQHGPTCHCGNKGCVEILAAGPSIANKGKEAAENGTSKFLAQRLERNHGTLTSIDISEAAAAGDHVAIEIIRQSGILVGSVLAGLVEFFNPGLILIGGGVSKIGFDFLSSIRQSVLQRSNPLSTRDLRIEYSVLSEMAGVTGAIWLTFDHVFKVQTRTKVKS